MTVGKALPLGADAGEEATPGIMIFGRVEVVRLVDEEFMGCLLLFDEGSLGRRQAHTLPCF